MKTYQEIFENALRRLNLSKKDVKDWKPAGDTYVPATLRSAALIFDFDTKLMEVSI